ncbi:DEAD/DEAH box helicase [Niveibacterium sp. SC-1]|uniref:DEAD/DEAH box helicase n=1 Tax=Niveibacterium sp. SC-1 TaxID=3135646 RepID=UPI00311D67B3
MVVRNPAETFSRADVARWCPEGEIRKAQSYIPRVARLVIEDTALHARVQGSARAPYEVEVLFRRDLVGGWYPAMECSCPVGVGCKHAVATLLAALEERSNPDRITPEVMSWVEELRDLVTPQSAASRRASGEQLFYLLDDSIQAGQLLVSLRKGRPQADGTPSPRATDWQNIERTLGSTPAFVDATDAHALRLLWSQRPRGRDWTPIPVTEQATEACLQAILATGRAFLHHTGNGGPRPLSWGETLVAQLDWRPDARGRVRPHFIVPGHSISVVAGDPACYVEAETATVGRLDSGLPAALMRHLQRLPPLGQRDRALVALALREHVPDLPAPQEDAGAGLREIAGGPQPLLELGTLPIAGVQRYRDYGDRFDLGAFDYAVPRFRYGELEIAPEESREFFTLASGEAVRLQRDREAEARALAQLETAGLEPVPARVLRARYAQSLPEGLYGLAHEEHWPQFMREARPALAGQGWSLRVPPGFRHLRLEVQQWHADVAPQEEGGEGGWFTLDLGITVEGQRLPLAPLLSELFGRDARWLSVAQLARIDEGEAVDLHLPQGDTIRVEAGRIKPLAKTLIDLFDRQDGQGRLPVSGFDAARIEALREDGRWTFTGPEHLHRLAQRLREASAPEPRDAPAGFSLALRPYQREGLGWLQYLRRNDLAGILADDMGLGKTAQTLAHLLTEKQEGRADRPSLIVLPTSLVFNWKREVEHCAPGLRVLALHGPKRAERFAQIPQHDLVLSTYPLVWRDAPVLAEQDWHFLVLDEAQTVKNAASKAASSLRSLRARHRLCLTGTPLENHLGELWAQFDFLLPGFLGSSRDFTRGWRTPIEKHGDLLRRELLARRLRPFILRRRKEDVAPELPEKTVVVRSVELEGAQRDLYETVRASVDATLQREIASRGFQRSQIAILDALLKLRQVCCDPRLLAAPASGKRAAASAKLELLMEMLPELIAEGRRILVFSQFTAMLDLVETELVQRRLGFLRLDGSTHDRETPVRRFQEGEQPIFLVSLKAGGVGLNLTAADTVIHFDPWWNPAAENQASDRAHRIGQTRAVFVYKLVVAGSIEEKIVALQEKKTALAEGILSEDASIAEKFSEADLTALLAPLPE